MRSIYKFSVPIKDDFTLELPKGAKPLAVQVQHGKPMLWVMVDPDEPTETRSFRLAGTGHPLADGVDYRHVGTFQMEWGALVFHLLEVL